MTQYFSESTLDEIRDKVDIVRMIGEYVPLKRAGRFYKGKCPFHNEKTPSFFVNPEWKVFKCFGCGESGNIFSFIMKYEGLTFVNAVERLAQQSGVVLQTSNANMDKLQSKKDNLYKIMKAAHRLLKNNLLDDKLGRVAQEYLKKRGFDRLALQKYGFGYAPDSWDFLKTKLSAQRFSKSDLINSGLLIDRPEKSTCYDRFRHRIIFPIREHRNSHLVAFGGRTLGEDSAKYLNTPETLIYKKNRVLFGLQNAKNIIRKTREVIVVEGYFDQISLLRAGIQNVVATCGTALTQEHVRILKQSALKIFLLFDPDIAGIAAGLRALKLCLSAGIETIAVPLPENKDPDDIINEYGGAEIEKLISNGLPALDFYLASAKKRFDLTRQQGRRDAVYEMIPFLRSVENSIDRGIYISRIAHLINVPETSIMEVYKRESSQRYKLPESDTAKTTRLSVTLLDSRERDFILLLLLYPKLIEEAQIVILPENLITNHGKILYSSIIENSGNRAKGKFDLTKMIDSLASEELKNIVLDISVDPDAQYMIKGKPSDALKALTIDFKRFQLKRKLENNRIEIQEKQAKGDDITGLLNNQMNLVKNLRELSSPQE